MDVTWLRRESSIAAAGTRAGLVTLVEEMKRNVRTNNSLIPPGTMERLTQALAKHKSEGYAEIDAFIRAHRSGSAILRADEIATLSENEKLKIAIAHAGFPSTGMLSFGSLGSIIDSLSAEGVLKYIAAKRAHADSAVRELAIATDQPGLKSRLAAVTSEQITDLALSLGDRFMLANFVGGIGDDL